MRREGFVSVRLWECHLGNGDGTRKFSIERGMTWTGRRLNISIRFYGNRPGTCDDGVETGEESQLESDRVAATSSPFIDESMVGLG